MSNVQNNTTLLGDSNFNINTVLFEEQYLSQIEELKDFRLDDDEFQTIVYDDDEAGYPQTLTGMQD